MNKKSKIKKIIPMILGTGIVVSAGINWWSYRNLVFINKDITNIKEELKNINSEYEELSLKVKNNRQNLSDLESENSKLVIK